MMFIKPFIFYEKSQNKPLQILSRNCKIILNPITTMARPNRLSKTIALASATSALLLSSCALPPEEAWQRIQSEGLIPYLSNSDSRESNVARHTNAPARQTPAPVTPPLPVVSTITSSGAASKSTEVSKPMLAQSVPSLPGFVRSPYTNPPRLIDVKGSKAGATMICPYTQRPFVIPSDYTNPTEMIAENEAPHQQPSVADTSDKPSPRVTVQSKKEDKPAAKKQATPEVASNKPSATPAPSQKEEPAPSVAPAKTAIQEIPYGLPITGRPGFVNSPFAAKHQLVDVTGLPTGMEVKCPYTGKLFRVPPSDVASQKPVANPAATENVEKK